MRLNNMLKYQTSFVDLFLHYCKCIKWLSVAQFIGEYISEFYMVSRKTGIKNQTLSTVNIPNILKKYDEGYDALEEKRNY